MMTPLIEVENLTKSFGVTRALGGMTLRGLPGCIHAVLGENGAGKSTLMKLLSGVYQPDDGVIRLAGREVRFSDPHEAQAAGISTIFQEFSLLPNLSVCENLFLGREYQDGHRIARQEMRKRASVALAALELDIDLDRRVGALGVGDQQMIEIAKGLLTEASVFIFDEPTAALASHEVETLFSLIRRLAANGKTIFYISHRLSEVFALCHDITIMKDGCFVRRVDTTATTADAVIEDMVGRPLEELFEARNPTPGKPILQADALVGGSAMVPYAITLHAGEILGIAGLEGQGQHELMRLLAGFDPVTEGALWLDGQRIDQLSSRHRMARGLGFVPESRKDDGLFPSLDIRSNMETAVNGRRPLLSWAAKLDAKVNEMMARLAVKAPSARTRVMDLSGGNQQKVVLGRWLVADARVLLCEEPTRGVDVGAKREIYGCLRDFTNAGGGILITSRELPELIGLCDRILVLRSGAIVDEVQAAQATEDMILRSALPPHQQRGVA